MSLCRSGAIFVLFLACNCTVVSAFLCYLLPHKQKQSSCLLGKKAHTTFKNQINLFPFLLMFALKTPSWLTYLMAITLLKHTLTLLSCTCCGPYCKKYKQWEYHRYLNLTYWFADVYRLHVANNVKMTFDPLTPWSPIMPGSPTSPCRKKQRKEPLWNLLPEKSKVE